MHLPIMTVELFPRIEMGVALPAVELMGVRHVTVLKLGWRRRVRMKRRCRRLSTDAAGSVPPTPSAARLPNPASRRMTMSVLLR